jgi:hypothetical protein
LGVVTLVHFWPPRFQSQLEPDRGAYRPLGAVTLVHSSPPRFLPQLEPYRGVYRPLCVVTLLVHSLPPRFLPRCVRGQLEPYRGAYLSFSALSEQLEAYRDVGRSPSHRRDLGKTHHIRNACRPCRNGR